MRAQPARGLERPRWQARRFVAVAAVLVEGELPALCLAEVPEPAQVDRRLVWPAVEDRQRVNVGKPPAEADVDRAAAPIPLLLRVPLESSSFCFTTSLLGDLDAAQRPIRVHALCPDAVATDMVNGRAGDPEAAVLFSATQLTAEQVAAEAISVLRTRRIVHPMPQTRGMIMRGAWLYPRAGLHAMALVRTVGQRRQRSSRRCAN